MSAAAAPAPFYADPMPSDDVLVADLLKRGASDPATEAAIDRRASDYINAIRAQSGGIGGVEDFLREYRPLHPRGPGADGAGRSAAACARRATAGPADRGQAASRATGPTMKHRAARWFVSASAWALGLSAAVIKPGETPEGIIAGLMKRLGLPTVRTATRQAMRLLGHHFVLGETIEDALDRARANETQGYRHSFDMLGEGARTARRRQALFQLLRQRDRGHRQGRRQQAALPDRPGISVKLSALHPRYRADPRTGCMAELVPLLLDLARKAKALRSQLHRRRRGSRPAGTVARRDRRGVRRSVARRLGRVRPRHPGLPEARAAA